MVSTPSVAFDGGRNDGMKLHTGYFADPFVLKTDDGYVAYGTCPERSDEHDDREFLTLTSTDLLTWRSHGGALERADPALGADYWAPEVAHADGRWWMYYSIGHDIVGHHIRVAAADHPLGPFTDLGVDLTPDERFAIDPHPFEDADGRRYLFFARDVLDADRPGTHLAVAPLEGMTQLGPIVEVLKPYADWQIYQRSREMYGAIHDWHTLEGPSVVRRHGRYWLTFSGGAWTGEGYAVSWAVADSPLGPWRPAPASAPALLKTSGDLHGPGHNSLTVDPNGDDVIVFHSWDATQTRREMYARRIVFERDGPRVAGPIGGAASEG
jgi:GH43 family beta-xylosidase